MTSDTNDTTIHSYDGNVQKYLAATPHEPSDDTKAWVGASLSGLPAQAAVLELGSGFGHDAAYIERLGYTVRRTDGTPGFVRLLQERGHEASVLNIVTDPIDGQYDLIFANAVLLHLTRAEMRQALQKIRAALSPGGRLAFSLKRGDGEAWTDDKLGAPLFFCYWQPDDIRSLLQECGYEDIRIDVVSGGEGKPQRLHVNAVR